LVNHFSARSPVATGLLRKPMHYLSKWKRQL